MRTAVGFTHLTSCYFCKGNHKVTSRSCLAYCQAHDLANSARPQSLSHDECNSCLRSIKPVTVCQPLPPSPPVPPTKGVSPVPTRPGHLYSAAVRANVPVTNRFGALADLSLPLEDFPPPGQLQLRVSSDPASIGKVIAHAPPHSKCTSSRQGGAVSKLPQCSVPHPVPLDSLPDPEPPISQPPPPQFSSTPASACPYSRTLHV